LGLVCNNGERLWKLEKTHHFGRRAEKKEGEKGGGMSTSIKDPNLAEESQQTLSLPKGGQMPGRGEGRLPPYRRGNQWSPGQENQGGLGKGGGRPVSLEECDPLLNAKGRKAFGWRGGGAERESDVRSRSHEEEERRWALACEGGKSLEDVRRGASCPAAKKGCTLARVVDEKGAKRKKKKALDFETRASWEGAVNGSLESRLLLNFQEARWWMIMREGPPTSELGAKGQGCCDTSPGEREIASARRDGVFSHNRESDKKHLLLC